MPRIAGTDIPDNKPLRIALRYIYGIGPKFADDICKQVGIDGQTRSHTLTEDQLAQIAGILESGFVVEGALRRQVSQNIQRLRDIRSYRGSRHRNGLPVRGQRTKTNARTRKGRKKTVAGKKSVKTMK
ncbi:MAG: 30S ribosomal protein S13 [Planctomycetes bacterium]|jgi:small subunit ribosomal protein S13|nr:30S ribosomal protein S13 [Planctomycetota bacterium]